MLQQIRGLAVALVPIRCIAAGHRRTYRRGDQTATATRDRPMIAHKEYSAAGTEICGMRIAHFEILGLTHWSLVTTGKKLMKKISTAFAVALGVAALAACNQSPREQAADNIEQNAEDVADNIEANADSVPGVTLNDTADNAADAVRAEGEKKADEVRNGADADGNSAN